MIVKEEPTYNVTVYIAGDIADVRRSLRQQCIEEGLCVTMMPLDFVYTAGLEAGVAIGFVTYPRFVKTPAEIVARAEVVARRLMTDLCQHSALIVADDKTRWLSIRPADLEAKK